MGLQGVLRGANKSEQGASLLQAEMGSQRTQAQTQVPVLGQGEKGPLAREGPASHHPGRKRQGARGDGDRSGPGQARPQCHLLTVHAGPGPLQVMKASCRGALIYALQPEACS